MLLNQKRARELTFLSNTKSNGGGEASARKMPDEFKTPTLLSLLQRGNAHRECVLMNCWNPRLPSLHKKAGRLRFLPVRSTILRVDRLVEQADAQGW